MNPNALNFKVTFYDTFGVRRVCLVRNAAGAGAAFDWVEQIHNPSRLVAAIRLDAPALQDFLNRKTSC